jgi:hypothetical protein
MPMFAKRHYEAIATAMQNAHVPRGVVCDPAKRNQWECVRNELTDVFARDNGQFDRYRFMRACEPGANVRARS